MDKNQLTDSVVCGSLERFWLFGYVYGCVVLGFLCCSQCRGRCPCWVPCLSWINIDKWSCFSYVAGGLGFCFLSRFTVYTVFIVSPRRWRMTLNLFFLSVPADRSADLLKMLARKSQGFWTPEVFPDTSRAPSGSDTSLQLSPGEAIPEFAKQGMTEDGVKATSTSTIVNTRSAVGIFERWLFEEHGNDQRKIEKIPPAELDHLLTEFWKGVQSRTSGQYRPGTLNNLRARLERHLRVCGYPHSIVKSEIFSRSRCAFRDKLAACKTKDANDIAPDQPFGTWLRSWLLVLHIDSAAGETSGANVFDGLLSSKKRNGLE